MIIEVDTRSPVPPYEQVRAQIARYVAGGTLTDGTRLPTVRQLAGDLGLATNSVARAYRELEHAGIVVSRGRHGTFVTDRATADGAPGTEADAAARAFVDAARRHGLDRAGAVALVERAWPTARAG